MLPGPLSPEINKCINKSTHSASNIAMSLTINILHFDEDRGGGGGDSPITCSECKIHRSEGPSVPVRYMPGRYHAINLC